jgi:hypothetical protein
MTQSDLWKLILDLCNLLLSFVSTFVVSGVAIWGVYTYFKDRKRDREIRQEELSWRKTQFILELAEDFEKDEQHQIASRLITYGTGLPQNSMLDKILCNSIETLSKPEMELRCAIDNYLDFFDRLYHFTFVTRSINVADIEVFGWYIAQIDAIKDVHEYAQAAGFEDVLRLNTELQKLFGERLWYKNVHTGPVVHQDNSVSASDQI